MIFKTATGSTYEIDETNKRVRRLSGVKAATARQGKDGDWRPYVDITEVKVGSPVMIFWDPASTPKLAETLELEKELGHEIPASPSTITSPVASIGS